MTRWLWVRHGPTHQKAFTGWRDVPADLSDAEQIARLRGFLPGSATLVSSDLIRASQTAEAIATRQTRLPDTALIREFDFGDWDGKGFAEVADTHPDLSRSYWESPGDTAPPNGESWNAAAARVGTFVDQINDDPSIQCIIAVAHMGVILTQYSKARGIPPNEAIGQNIRPLSVSEFIFRDGRWHVEIVDHIP